METNNEKMMKSEESKPENNDEEEELHDFQINELRTFKRTTLKFLAYERNIFGEFMKETYIKLLTEWKNDREIETLPNMINYNQWIASPSNDLEIYEFEGLIHSEIIALIEFENSIISTSEIVSKKNILIKEPTLDKFKELVTSGIKIVVFGKKVNKVKLVEIGKFLSLPVHLITYDSLVHKVAPFENIWKLVKENNNNKPIDTKSYMVLSKENLKIGYKFARYGVYSSVDFFKQQKKKFYWCTNCQSYHEDERPEESILEQVVKESVKSAQLENQPHETIFDTPNHKGVPMPILRNETQHQEDTETTAITLQTPRSPLPFNAPEIKMEISNDDQIIPTIPIPTFEEKPDEKEVITLKNDPKPDPKITEDTKELIILKPFLNPFEIREIPIPGTIVPETNNNNENFKFEGMTSTDKFVFDANPGGADNLDLNFKFDETLPDFKFGQNIDDDPFDEELSEMLTYEKFELESKNHFIKLIQRNPHDCVFVVTSSDQNVKEFPCHSIMIQSQKLYDLFKIAKEESSTEKTIEKVKMIDSSDVGATNDDEVKKKPDLTIVKIENEVDHDVFEILIDFFYGINEKIKNYLIRKQNYTYRLPIVAKEFGSISLERYSCQLFLIDAKNVLSIYENAKKHNLGFLKNRCISFLTQARNVVSIGGIAVTDCFNEWHKLDKDILLEIITKDSKNKTIDKFGGVVDDSQRLTIKKISKRFVDQVYQNHSDHGKFKIFCDGSFSLFKFVRVHKKVITLQSELLKKYVEEDDEGGGGDIEFFICNYCPHFIRSIRYILYYGDFEPDFFKNSKNYKCFGFSEILLFLYKFEFKGLLEILCKKLCRSTICSFRTLSTLGKIGGISKDDIENGVIRDRLNLMPQNLLIDFIFDETHFEEDKLPKKGFGEINVEQESENMANQYHKNFGSKFEDDAVDISDPTTNIIHEGQTSFGFTVQKPNQNKKPKRTVKVKY